MSHKERDITYGVISVGTHSVNPPRHLFGSNIKHANCISLRVSTAYMAHSDEGSTHKAFPCDDERVVEVYLSLNQWAELLAGMNSGYVPCTFRYLNGGLISECPPPANALERESKAAIKGMNRAGQISQEEADTFARILEKKTRLTPADKKSLENLFSKARNSSAAVLDFCLEQYQEVTESIVTEAKVEINQYAQRVAETLPAGAAQEAVASIAAIGEEE